MKLKTQGLCTSHGLDINTSLGKLGQQRSLEDMLKSLINLKGS